MGHKAMKELKVKYNNALRSEKNYALINMNIRKFRYFNYAYGAKAADQILRDVKKTISSFLQEDEAVIRKDADDFIILVAYTDRKDMESRWILQLIDLIFDIQNPYVYHNIYTSFGIYLIESKDVTLEEAYERAQFCRIMSDSLDMRTFTYEFYDHKVYEDYMHSCYLEEYSAKAREQGLYQVYIQPKVDLKSDQIIGGEALLRLFDQGELIPVSKFLPMLNKNGYIRMVDMHVFETVVKEIEERMKHNRPNVRISFNVSNSFFNDACFIRDYTEILKRYEIDNRFLEIEFMESIGTNEAKMEEYVSAFHAMGICCSLDDFGKGFSNFSLLKDCKLDVIKVDRCFFEQVLDEANKEILKTIIHLIQFLGMEVVAEGVERKEDVAFLKSIGCDAVQGFYYYKPMPMKEFFSLLDEKNHR